MKMGDTDRMEELAQREARLKEQLSSKPSILDILSGQPTQGNGAQEDTAKLHSAVRLMTFLSCLLMISCLTLAALHVLRIVPNEPASAPAMAMYLQVLAGMALINMIAVTVIRALLTRVTALGSRVEELHRKIESPAA